MDPSYCLINQNSGRILPNGKRHVLFLLLLVPFIALVEGNAGNDTATLADLSIEQLMNESVTSVSKKETKLYEAPAAITLITQEDIRRSGMTTLPELLRMVPGLEVARVNEGQSAISSRGFNDQYANKLLVLVDGRSVYTPSFGGVYWSVQDVVLDDLARIEVIRGPGASLWGANAVNGVINIVTKSAKETQGGLINASYGTEDHPSTTIRYGDQLATNLYFRVYAKYFDRDSGLVNSTGKAVPDDWSSGQGGFRLDWEPAGQNTLTLQGDYYDGHVSETAQLATLTPPYSQTSDFVDHNFGGNILGRWTHSFSESSSLVFQTYYDHFKHDDPYGSETRDTADFDVQHRFAAGSANDVVWGLGYRYTIGRLPNSPNVIWTQPSQQIQVYSAFVQDDLTLVADRLHFISGSKFEHNSISGFEFQPSGRLLWTPTKRQTAWASVSRAVRTPSFAELDTRVNFLAFQPPPPSPPVLVSAFGNPNLESENLLAYELGYRIEPTERLSFDLTGFYNVYNNLLTYVPNSPSFEFSPPPAHVLVSNTEFNAGGGETFGTELSAQWNVIEHWRLVGSYTWLAMRLHPDLPTDRMSPQQQWQVRSYLDLPFHLELNGAAYYVDQISVPFGTGTVAIPSYIRLDLGLAWHPTKSLEIGIWGQNLSNGHHAEFSNYKTPLQTEIPRSVVGIIRWRF